MSDAESALINADRLLFVGYSLPIFDVHAERLFKKAIAANARLSSVDVVNPSPETRSGLPRVATPTSVHWHASLETFLDHASFR